MMPASAGPTTTRLVRGDGMPGRLIVGLFDAISVMTVRSRQRLEPPRLSRTVPFESLSLHRTRPLLCVSTRSSARMDPHPLARAAQGSDTAGPTRL